MDEEDYLLDTGVGVSSPRPEIKTSDWRFGMTTCIAAIAWNGLSMEHFIVVACDTRMSFGGDFSVENVIKLEEIHREWSVLIAGSDVSQAPFVIQKAKDLLRGAKNRPEIVRDAVKKAFQEQLRELIADKFLSPYGMTLEEFKKKGRVQLETNLYQALSFGIKDTRLGCRFLVYGFDKDRHPHLFDISDPGKVESRDKPGFWAIGRGQVSALSTLANLKQASEATGLNETIYNVLAAKYTSESASDVGPETFLFVKRFGCNAFVHPPRFEEQVKKIWEEDGRPRTIPRAIEMIKNSQLECISGASIRKLKRLARKKNIKG